MTRFLSIMEAAIEISRQKFPDGSVSVYFSDGSRYLFSRGKSIETWYDSNGRLHREDGPADINREEGLFYWYRHNKSHNTNGPSFVDTKRKLVAYSVNGVPMPREEFLKHFDDTSEYKDWEESTEYY